MSANSVNSNLNIGQVIQSERKKLGLTQPKFAKNAGLGLRFVKELEEGKQTVRLDKLNQALSYLGMTISIVPVDYAILHENTPDSVVIKEVIEICKRRGVKHLYLYGSYANGTAKRTSDFDFAIQGFKGNLGDLTEELDNIRTLKEIDLVDYDSITNELLRENIDKYGRKIY